MSASELRSGGGVTDDGDRPGYEEVAAEGARVLEDTHGGRRLRETREFFAFIRAEQPRLIERWQAHRRRDHTVG